MTQVKVRKLMKVFCLAIAVAVPVGVDIVHSSAIAHDVLGTTTVNTTNERVYRRTIQQETPMKKTPLTVGMTTGDVVIVRGEDIQEFDNGYVLSSDSDVVFGDVEIVEIPKEYQSNFEVQISKKSDTPVKIAKHPKSKDNKGELTSIGTLKCKDFNLYDMKYLKVTDEIGNEWYVEASTINYKVRPLNHGFRIAGTERKEIAVGERNLTLDVTTPTNLTASELYNYTQGTGLEGIEHAVVDIEKNYGINALFTLALATLESGHGESYLARERNNLFGICAYDGNEGAASYYNSKSECVHSWGKLIHDGYFSEGLTTLEGINSIYASNPNWANQVRSIMSDIAGRV